MSNIIVGNFHDIGAREIYEDRVKSAEFKTAGGVSLAVGIVADGVGGANKGERAAQLAVDSVLSYLRGSRETDVPTLLTHAAQAANAKVHAEARQSGGASCTLAMAVIVDGKTLYVANVGDSRVYLIRNEKLTQLTMDHSFANVMVMQGKMSRESAEINQRAEVLMRALGPKPQIAIDVGFYVGTENYQVAQERGQKGLPLKEGDSVIICSDGLIKSGVDGKPFTTEDEIVQTLNRQEGEKAARELISFAIGRNADDNVSVATLQMPDPNRTMTLAKERAAEAASRRKRTYGIVAVAAAIILALGGVIFGLSRTNQETQNEADAIAAQSTLDAISLEETRDQNALFGEQTREFETFQETAIAQTIAAHTPTPTNTPRPTLAPLPAFSPGDIGVAYSQDSESPVQERQTVTATGELTTIQIDDEQGDDRTLFASFYAHDGAAIFFDLAVRQRMQLALRAGSDLYVDAGKYTGGIEIELDPDDDVMLAFDQCFSLQYADDQLVANCYGGSCSYDTPDVAATWEAGEQLVLDTKLFSATTQPIPIAQGMADREFILGSADGELDAQRCLNTAYEPTPTPFPPTPTRIVVPTFTPRPTNTPRPRPTNTSLSTNTGGGVGSNPTNTPRPQPTNTPRPQPTNTPRPRPTNTPRPQPTNTPRPQPTNTPRPGNTSPPPTNTPRPQPTNTPRPQPTNTPRPGNTLPPPTNTPRPTNTSVPPTNTPVPPTSTPRPTNTTPPEPTRTPVPPTNTPVPPTNTPVPPTNTPVPPTNTPVPPTNTPVPPTNTPVPPTNTPVPPTNTPVPPTNTPVPPTNTPIPPTSTPVPPTNTPIIPTIIPPTNTPVPPPTNTPAPPPTNTPEPPPTNTPEPPPTNTPGALAP